MTGDFIMSTRVGMVSLGCPKNQVDAEHMLYDEFAYVLDIPHNEVVPFISGQLQQ